MHFNLITITFLPLYKWRIDPKIITKNPSKKCYSKFVFLNNTFSNNKKNLKKQKKSKKRKNTQNYPKNNGKQNP